MFQNKRKSNKYRVYSLVRFYDYDTNLEEERMTDIFENLSQQKQEQLRKFITKYKNISIEEWKNNILSEYQELQTDYSALIFHDKDILPDGTNKSLHCHIVIKTKNLQSFKSIKETLMPHNNRQENFGFTISEGGQLRYLLHLSEEALKDKKHRYDIEELYLFLDNRLITDIKEKNDWYSEKISQDFKSDLTQRQRESQNEQNFLNILKQDVKLGNLYPEDVYDEIEKKFGIERAVELYTPRLKAQIDLLRNKNLEDKELKAKRDNKNRKKTHLSNIFISAEGGKGKSIFAESLSHYILEKEGLDSREIFGADASTQKANTLFSLYKHEHISIFNEIDYTMTQAEFCKAFEKDSPLRNVTNRHKNIINTSRYCIFTKSDPFSLWSSKIGQNKISKDADPVDKVWQIRRRFELILEIRHGYLTIYRYTSPNDKQILRRYQEFSPKDIINPNSQVIECFEFIHQVCNQHNQ